MIVTSRARWLLLLCLVASVYSLAQQNALLLRVAVAITLWLGFEWFAFRYQIDFRLSRMRLERRARDRQGPIRAFWESRDATITTNLRFGKSWIPLPYVRVAAYDLVPTGVDRVEGENGALFLLGQAKSLEIAYHVRPTTPGVVRFPGVRFVVQDLHGFFHAERFVATKHELRVMPQTKDAGTLAIARKQENVLPPPGIHNVAKPGLGSDLMEIRSYVPGDSQRSIAWKVTARRDELMSKQFESEVPIRCQLFVDMSPAIRLGYPGPSQAARIVSLASTLAYTLAANRDPVGVSIFDGKRINVSPASANRTAIMRMIDRLCIELDAPLPLVDAPLTSLLRSSYDLARIRDPKALHAYEGVLSPWWPYTRRWRMRVTLAGILVTFYGVDQVVMADLIEDDQLMSHWLQRFHQDHGAPYAGDLFDSQGDYLFDDRAKLSQLSQMIRRCAARGRDNELFVVMAELTDTEYELSEFLQAIKFARARHHRVAVLLAWPQRMPPPTPPKEAYLPEDATTRTGYLVDRYQKDREFAQLKSDLAKLGVPVVAAADKSASALILNQMDILRAGRCVA